MTDHSAPARFFDTHAHLDGERFREDLDATLARARSAGLTDIVCVGASEGFESNPRAVELTQKHEGLWATVGMHPHDAAAVDETCLAQLRVLATDPKVVAIGETGLDYYYEHAPRVAQAEAFRAFIQLSKAVSKPLVIHTRDAEADTIAILRAEQAEQVGGVIHCFTGTQELADAALSLGFYISLSGVLTFKKADALREIARTLPRDRVLVETDCPYLAPIPHRGKRNEPSYVVHTVAALATLWGASSEEVRAQTGANAAKFFRLTGAAS